MSDWCKRINMDKWVNGNHPDIDVEKTYVVGYGDTFFVGKFKRSGPMLAFFPFRETMCMAPPIKEFGFFPWKNITELIQEEDGEDWKDARKKHVSQVKQIILTREQLNATVARASENVKKAIVWRDEESSCGCKHSRENIKVNRVEPNPEKLKSAMERATENSKSWIKWEPKKK